MPVLTLLATLAAPAHAGAWTQEPGSAYGKVVGRFLVGDEAFEDLTVDSPARAPDRRHTSGWQPAD